MQKISADVAIIGGGIAGLSAALGLSQRKVVVVTKAEFGKGGSTPIAQGGIACAMGKDDSPDLHTADTLVAGDGLSVKDCVDILTAEGPEQIRKLIENGAQFDRTPDGELSFGREAAHCRRRILHANGDSTGAEVERALVAAVKKCPNIEIVENCYVADLIQDQNGAISGLYGRINGGGDTIVVEAQAVVLACGGIGRLSIHDEPRRIGRRWLGHCRSRPRRPQRRRIRPIPSDCTQYEARPLATPDRSATRRRRHPLCRRSPIHVRYP